MKIIANWNSVNICYQNLFIISIYLLSPFIISIYLLSLIWRIINKNAEICV